MEAGVGDWSRKEDGKGGEAVCAVSDSVLSDGTCVVSRRMPLPAQAIMRVVSEDGVGPPGLMAIWITLPVLAAANHDLADGLALGPASGI